MKSVNTYDVQVKKNNGVPIEKKLKKLKCNSFSVSTSKPISVLKNKQHLSKKVKKLKSSFELSEINTTNACHNILKKRRCDTVLEPAKNLKNVNECMKNSKLSLFNAGLKLNCNSNHKKKQSVSNVLEDSRKNKKPITTKKQLCNRESTEEEKSTQHNNRPKEYEPGMLSNLLQLKKYGCLVLPWDSSFGLDSTYKMCSDKEDNEQEQVLKINPLFDLCKRKREHSTSSNHMENTVFVGNLPYKTRNMDLKKMFRKFGKILHVKIRHKNPKAMKNVQNKEKNLSENHKHLNALVRFKNVDSCKAALQMNGALYEGHHLRVTLAKNERISDPRKCVFLGNLAFGTKDDDVWKEFQECGEIESVRVVRDERTGIGKGFGYINFKSADSVDAALKLDGMTFLDRSVRIRRNHSDARSLSNSITVKKKRKKYKQHGNTNTVLPKLKQEVIEKEFNFVSTKPVKLKKEAGVRKPKCQTLID